MQGFLLLALGGFIAQLVDGSLGMAYGITSTTILLTAGLTPALTSASVHLAEIGTAAASGLSHYKLGNVDFRIVLTMGLPGAAGAFLGATALSTFATTAAKPWMAGILLLLGLYVLARFTLRAPRRPAATSRGLGRAWLAPLGLLAGFLDATGGGGWGPVSTPTLLSTGRVEPRKVVGSVDTSELFIGVAASAGFLTALGGSGLSWTTVAALLVGGVLAAPLAAYLVRIVPARLIGVGAGGLIVLTNTRILVSSAELPAPVVIYTVVICCWGLALAHTIRALLVQRRGTAAADSPHAAVEQPAETREPEPVG